MPISFIEKDVTTVTSGVVAHGCNCQGVMGSGVAAALRGKWPSIFDSYKRVVDGTSTPKQRQALLGLAVIVNVADQTTDPFLFVSNMFTQYEYGNDGRVYASLPAIDLALEHTLRFCRAAGNVPLYIPRIGCGLGGLNWDTQVGVVVENQSKTFDQVPIFVCDYNP